MARAFKRSQPNCRLLPLGPAPLGARRTNSLYRSYYGSSSLLMRRGGFPNGLTGMNRGSRANPCPPRGMIFSDFDSECCAQLLFTRFQRHVIPLPITSDAHTTTTLFCLVSDWNQGPYGLMIEVQLCQKLPVEDFRVGICTMGVGFENISTPEPTPLSSLEVYINRPTVRDPTLNTRGTGTEHQSKIRA